ncbi:SH2 domain-containing protein [Trichonephila inaurata madagascariensis]|uniref:SH2 domain-containing protein n=1 Tax=Trichonephila inaurata madagascariensis TaxID=2747483 RepID=A0A8X6XD65_9ARAC|nr:SH2 domain-containing protein [Trichonephila inaurata madagascariensis]
MSYASDYQNAKSVQGLEDEDDGWGSDFEESETELCSQEIQDNLINESREAYLLEQKNKVSTNNFQQINTFPIDKSQCTRIITGDTTTEARKTGAIPKLGFSYLNNITNTNISENSWTNVNNFGNNIHQNSAISPSSNQNSKILQQSQNSSRTLAPNSRNMLSSCTNDDVEQLPQRPTGILRNETPMNKNPRKLKPEAFSFLNKIPPTSNESNTLKENNSNISKERKHLVPTAFAHTENLRDSLLLDETVTNPQSNLHDCVNVVPNESPIGNSSDNYEPVEVLRSTRETVKPPLPTRPPPVLKYPPGTFSNSRSISLESAMQNTVSQPSAHSISTRAKFEHSNSSPVSNLGDANKTKKSSVVTKNVLSLPKKNTVTAAIPPDILTRPLPPLPVSDPEGTENTGISSGKTHCESTKSLKSDNKSIEVLIAKATAPYEIPIPPKAGAPPYETSITKVKPTSRTTIYPMDKSNCNELIAEDSSNKEEQSILTPQQRLAQMIVNQSNVSSEVLRSQIQITSAIAARSQNNISQARPKPKVEKPIDENVAFSTDDRSNISNTHIPRSRRSLESSVEASKEEKSEQKQVNSEDGESTNSRRFPDQETLINAMSRPMLPQKAIPMQRSVSCNSLVQTIKDLGFSVWNKPDKKRNSDGLYLPKKSSKSSSPVSSGKAISPPKTITLISFTTKEDSQNGKNDASSTDEKRDLFQYPWYHEVNSKEATNRLLSVGENGAYLVRPSTVITEEIKNTLCVLHDWKIRNMYIRKKEDGLYSLGSKKLFEQTFSSIPELVEYHQREPIEIKPFGGSSSSQPTIYVLLRKTPSKSAKVFI